MSLNFGQIPPLTTELAALEHLKNRCHHVISVDIDPIFFKLAGNKDMHNIMKEFEFRPDRTTDYGVSCPWASKKYPYRPYNGENGVSTFSLLFLIESFWYFHVTRTSIKAWMSLNFFEMRFDLGTLDSGERSVPFGLLVFVWKHQVWVWIFLVNQKDHFGTKIIWLFWNFCFVSLQPSLVDALWTVWPEWSPVTQYLTLVCEKQNPSMVFIGDSKSQPSVPPFKWETRQSLVSHLNGEHSGWDFTVAKEHQWLILFIRHMTSVHTYTCILGIYKIFASVMKKKGITLTRLPLEDNTFQSVGPIPNWSEFLAELQLNSLDAKTVFRDNGIR